MLVLRSRQPGARRSNGLPGPRCNPHQPDYHLTFAADVHPCSPAKSTVVAATLPSPCSGGGGCGEQSSSGENDYFRTWQLQRHVSCPAAAATTAAAAVVPVRTAGIGRPTPASLRLLPGAGEQAPRRAAPEHIYESPRLERREIVLPSPTAAGECTCCEPRRASVDLLAVYPQSNLQYYELDQSARPAHL